MSSFDKNQAWCTQKALDITESNGELLWQRRCEQDSSATILKEIIFLLSLIMSTNYRKRACYHSFVSNSFSSSLLQNHFGSSLFRPNSVASLGFQLYSSCNVKYFLCQVPWVQRCPDHGSNPQVAQRKEEADRCTFTPGCSYYQQEPNQLGLEDHQGLQ